MLGMGFLGYLGYAKATMPDSLLRLQRPGRRPDHLALLRPGGPGVLGGLAALAPSAPRWPELGRQPLASAGFLAGWAAVGAVLGSELERRLLMPLCRLRLRVFGHPLVGRGDQVPVVASVELLEDSLAWEAASPIVRSALVDHWDEGGWRILRYTGVYGSGVRARPVSVLFAMDTGASQDTTVHPAVGVTVIDDDTDEVVAVDLLTGRPARPALPLVT
ncbi:hypothetical protein [Streptomyces sp. NBC_00154]|uniref:hypothetical protein n=1 Tax=Streptomyces sp. NBC_00154 TaxID=2975670 RepID=UPI002259068D|nr:hypothetical protein [Streptomyces sp. NBC_00154]MCX5316192.1 hypothetical protein [Streptomyces sp. NBC_00154]